MEVSNFHNDILLAEACREDVDKYCNTIEAGAWTVLGWDGGVQLIHATRVLRVHAACIVSAFMIALQHWLLGRLLHQRPCAHAWACINHMLLGNIPSFTSLHLPHRLTACPLGQPPPLQARAACTSACVRTASA